MQSANWAQGGKGFNVAICHMENSDELRGNMGKPFIHSKMNMSGMGHSATHVNKKCNKIKEVEPQTPL